MQHRYYSLDQYLKNRFQSKVFKVALNGNFSCPNRDGTLSTKGCIFCSESGSGDFAGSIEDSLDIQFYKIKAMMHQKWPDAKYIAYFQANTNTYAPLEKLKTIYEQVIDLDPNIVCLSIATRPDTLSDDILDYLAILNQKIPVWIELGLQTIHEPTAIYINRGYPLSTFHEAMEKLQQRNIETIVHIINGLPNETKDDMLATIEYLNKRNIQGIKIHSLYIQKDTELGNIYLSNPFPLLSLEAYVDIVCEQIALLNPNVIIHRISGDAPRNKLIAPLWSLKKFVVMNEIDKRMRVLDYHQGIKYK